MNWWDGFETYVLVFFFLVVAVAMILQLRRSKRARENWQALARNYGLSYQPPKPLQLFSKRAAVAFQDPGEVHGELEGLPFRLHVAVYGTGKDRRVFTVMSVEIPGLPQGLRVYRENAFLRFTKLFGAQDIVTGDSAFDRHFLVKGKNPTEVLTWLDETRRQAFINTIAEDADMDIRDGCLYFQRGQVVDDVKVLETALGKIRSLIPFMKPRGKGW